jgi:hypothetical protein
MARRRRDLTPQERRRSRRVLAAVGCAAAVALAVFLLAWAPWRRDGQGEWEHEHKTAPHGGTLASLGVEEPHDHAEAVLELGGVLTVYTFRPDARASLAVERQLLTAWAWPEGEERAAEVSLMPMPLPGDAPGTASRFKGRLPERLWGRDTYVTVARVATPSGRFRVKFGEVKSPADEGGHRAELRRLYLTPRGKYGAADVQANGNTTAAEKFGGGQAAAHDLAPAGEGWICPVAAARAEPGVVWVVGGRDYRFCCTPAWTSSSASPRRSRT